MDGVKENKPNYIYVAKVIGLYWFVSISMVYLNKILLSSESVSIPAPVFVTWFQCVITSLICIILGNMGEVTRSQGKQSFLNEFPRVKYDFKNGFQVLPLSLIFVAMITFNNICLKYVEVSFYNVARSLSLVFNVVFTYFVLGNATSLATCSTLLLIIVGFYLGIDGEINFSLFGTVCGVISSLFVSLNGIYTAKVCNHPFSVSLAIHK
jgi:GDP-fucose transporter C1